MIEDTYHEYVPGATAAAFESFTGQQRPHPETRPARRHDATIHFLQQCWNSVEQRLQGAGSGLNCNALGMSVHFDDEVYMLYTRYNQNKTLLRFLWLLSTSSFMRNLNIVNLKIVRVYPFCVIGAQCCTEAH